MLLQLVPGDFAAAVGGHAAQHAGERGFDAGGDLVVELAAGDAVDEAAVLVAVGELEVVRKAPLAANFAGSVGLVVLPDRTRSRRSRRGCPGGRSRASRRGRRAVDALGDVEAEVAELGGREAEVDVVG